MTNSDIRSLLKLFSASITSRLARENLSGTFLNMQKSNDVENRVGFGKRQAECNPGSTSAGCVVMGKPPNLSETKCPHFYHLSIIVGISVLLRIK